MGGVHELNSVDVGLVAHSMGSRDRILTSGKHREGAGFLAVKRPTVQRGEVGEEAFSKTDCRAAGRVFFGAVVHLFDAWDVVGSVRSHQSRQYLVGLEGQLHSKAEVGRVDQAI